MTLALPAISTPAAPTRPLPRRALGRKLALALIGLVAFVLLANGAGSLWLNYREARATAVRLQQEKAQASAARIELFIGEIENQIGWTTKAEWSFVGIDQRRYDFIRLLRQEPAITELIQVDATGKEQLRLSRLEPDVVGSGADLSADPRFVQAVANKIWFSAVTFRHGSEPYITLALAQASKKPGVTIAEVNLKLIWDAVNAIRIGEAGTAYVVDAGGKLIAHPDISLVLRGTDLTALPQVAAALGKINTSPAPGPQEINTDSASAPEGGTVLTAHATIARLGWTVFVQQPLRQALAPLYAALVQTAVLLGLGLLLASLLGLFLARRIVAPIKLLQAGAEKLGAGDLSQRLSVRSGDEIETLADRFNAMAGQVQESYATLEGKVETRTHDLGEALKRQTATSDILRVISQSPTDTGPVFEAIVLAAIKLLGCDVAGIGVVSGNLMTPKAVATPRGLASDLGPVHDLSDPQASFPARAIAAKKTLYLADWSQIDLPEKEERVRAASGLSSSVYVTMLRGGEAVGGMIFGSKQANAFDAARIAQAESFADQALIAIENTRLFNETQQALERQTATADILKVIASSPSDVQPVFDAIATSANRLLGGFSTTVFRFIDEALQLVAFTPTNRIADDALQASFPMPRANFPPYEMVREGKAVQFTDTETESGVPLVIRNLARLRGYRSMLFTALMRNHIPVGMISVTRKEPGSFAAHHVQLLQTFADQAVIAIQNVRLFEDVQEALAQQTATADVLKVINRSAFDLQAVLDTLVRTAHDLCAAEYGVVWMKRGDKLYLDASYGLVEDARSLLLNNPVTPDADSSRPASVAAATGATFHTEHYKMDPTFNYVQPLASGERWTALAVPLKSGDTIEGVIMVGRYEVRRFSDSQVNLMQTFADQAVIAIKNVRLFDEVQARTRDLGEALAQQTATADVLKVISRSAFDLQAVLDTLINSAVRVCAADQGAIYQKMGDLFHWVAQSSDGFSAEFVDFARAHPFAPGTGSITARVALTGKVVHIEDVLADPEYVALGHQRLGNYRTMLGVPLLREGVPIGVFTLVREHVEAFTDRQIELVTSFADQAVIAIENVRLFENEQARTRELAESLEYQTAASEVLKVIGRSPSQTQPVLDMIVRTAQRLCQSDSAHIMRLKGGKQHLASSFNMHPEAVDFLSNNPIAPGRGSVTGRVALEGRTIQVPDVLADAEYTLSETQSRVGYRTVLCVPLLNDGVVIGVINLLRLVVRPFTQRQIDLVTAFADQAVIAIENARLFDEVQARTKELSRSVGELKALGEVGAAVTATLDLQKVQATIVTRAVELAGADAGAIFRYRKSDRTFRMTQAAGLAADHETALRAINVLELESSMGEAVRSMQVAQIADIATRPSFPLRDAALAAGFHAVLILPLAVPGRTLGALVLQKRAVGEFPDNVVNLMQTFASQSVLAIQNARLFEEIAENSRQLEIASQHKSQFLANMSHELRTPLNAILGYTELLIDGIYGELADKPRSVLERVQQNGKHLLGLINDVLDLSKIEAGQLTLTLEDYGLPALVDTVVATTDSIARTKGLKLLASVAPGMPHGHGDARRLTQVLLNLVGNALKFTDDGEVRIDASCTGGRFAIAVTDTGPGIAGEDQKRIFEEFRQVDNTSTRNKGGSGLGLAISTRIVEMHGGTITVASVLGTGSTFTIDLPVRAPEPIA